MLISSLSKCTRRRLGVAARSWFASASIDAPEDDNHIIKSPFASVIIPDVLLHDYLMPFKECPKRLEARVAFVEFETGASATHGQVLEGAENLSEKLIGELHFTQGDCVALYSPNTVHYFSVVVGCLKAGLIVTTVDPSYGYEPLKEQLVHSQTKLLIVQKLGGTAERVATALKIPCMTISDAIAPLKEPSGVSALSQMWAITKGRFGMGKPPPRPEDTALLPYLYAGRGPTSLPRAAMLSHKSLVANLCQLHEPEGINIKLGITGVCCLPFFRMDGLQMCNLLLRNGGTMVTMPPRKRGREIHAVEIEPFLEAVKRYRAHRLYVSPPWVLALATDPLVERYDLSTVEAIIVNGSPLGASVIENAERRTGAVLKQGWGMTELSCVGSIDADDNPTRGSSGPLLAGMQGRIMDLGAAGEKRRAVAPANIGELYVTGPNIMRGYLNDENATAEVLSDGYLKTGDAAYVNEKGCLFFLGRVSDMIRSLGELVAPVKIEDLLLSHPDVRDAVVTFIPTKIKCERLTADELPTAYVSFQEGHSSSIEDLQRFIEERSPPSHHLRGGIHIVEAVPRSPGGKKLRSVAKSWALNLASVKDS